MNTWWSLEQQHTLRVGDVMPLPLMIETNWATEGWEVNVTLVTHVDTGGYRSIDIWTHREPYGDGPRDEDEAARVTEAAATKFGLRLRELLGEPHLPNRAGRRAI